MWIVQSLYNRMTRRSIALLLATEARSLLASEDLSNVCYVDDRALYRISRVVSGIWANTISDPMSVDADRPRKSEVLSV